MVSVADVPLAALCREADPATVREFVAALYAARGYTVERTDVDLMCLTPGDRTVAVLPSERPPDAADAVVALDPGTHADDIEVIDVDSLHQQLSYALDYEDARHLLVTHFDFDPDEAVPDDDPEEDGAGADSDPGAVVGVSGLAPRRASSLVAMVAIVAAVVLLAGLGIGGVVEFPAGDSAARTGETVTPVSGVNITSTPTPDIQANTFDASPPRGEDAVQGPDSAAEHLGSQSYPPGIDSEGLADIDELIAAHRSHLTNTSYTMTIRYQEFADGRASAVYVETIKVENESRYSVSVSTVGELETTPRLVVGADVFVSGDQRYVRVEATEPYVRRRSTPSRFLGQMSRYLRWSLSAEESTLRGRQTVGNRTTFRVTTDEDPFQGIQNAAGVVYVTEEGRVIYGRWTYLTIRPDARVEFSIRTSNVGTTTVSRPGWVDEG